MCQFGFVEGLTLPFEPPPPVSFSFILVGKVAERKGEEFQEGIESSFITILPLPRSMGSLTMVVPVGLYSELLACKRGVLAPIASRRGG